MPDRNLLLEAMRAGADVVFDPYGSENEPSVTEVEWLLGGVPVVTFTDGTEQFLDVAVEPAIAYSPRLEVGRLEDFCKENIRNYQAFNAEHGEEKLMTERVPMIPFW